MQQQEQRDISLRAEDAIRLQQACGEARHLPSLHLILIRPLPLCERLQPLPLPEFPDLVNRADIDPLETRIRPRP